MLDVIIARPTRLCNADCFYCSAPPDGTGKWSFATFCNYFDKLEKNISSNATWIWHGGEPMILGKDFFYKCHEYALKKIPNLKFAMQSNLLAYNSTWKDLFEQYFKSSLSSSFDPDKSGRTIKGNAQKFQTIFTNSLDNVINDGFSPMLIATIDDNNIHLVEQFYNWNYAKGEKALPLRINYCYPTGKLLGKPDYLVEPEKYGDMLVNLYNRWIKDKPYFSITPFDQMIKLILESENIGFCPWTSGCGGKFLEIEPNGDVYNCSDFADFKDKQYSFGNMNTHTFEELMLSNASKEIQKRPYFLPMSCNRCEHNKECQGGCSQHTVLFGDKIKGGKFPYCLSWKKIFTRIKESILKSEIDHLLIDFGFIPDIVKNNLKNKIAIQYELNTEEIEQLMLGKKSSYGFYNNSINVNKINTIAYQCSEDVKKLLPNIN